MNDNVDIFIGTQKTFEPKVSNNVYKIIVGNHDIENNSNLELIKCKHDEKLDDRFFSEIYMLDFVSKNYELKDYVGFCHNRRYFKFMDNIPDIEEILKDAECIIAKPIKFKKNNKEQYNTCHNVEDLYIIGGILAEKYPDYVKGYNIVMKSNIFIPYNMFIMKKEDFLEYIKFIKGVLDEYINIIGTDVIRRIAGNKEKYLKRFYPNSSIEYQYRIGGYLAERLTNVYIIKKFKKIKAFPVVTTESRYKRKKIAEEEKQVKQQPVKITEESKESIYGQ